MGFQTHLTSRCTKIAKTTVIAIMLTGSTMTLATESSTAKPPAAQSRQLVAEAKSRIQKFAGELKTALQAGMKQGGPANAIDVCNTASPELAASNSGEGWEIGRTSLKLRNPNNAPDEWEQSVLEDFERRLKAGEPVATLSAVKQTDTEFRFMKAIPTQQLCLNCHGSDLTPEVTEALSKRYPQDQARGFNVGDIRGAFTLRKSLSDS